MRHGPGAKAQAVFASSWPPSPRLAARSAKGAGASARSFAKAHRRFESSCGPQRPQRSCAWSEISCQMGPARARVAVDHATLDLHGTTYLSERSRAAARR